MCAEYIKMGEMPPTVGGDFEREVATTLQQKLSDVFVILGNPCFPSASSFFYEFDAVVLAPFLCDVIEAKHFPVSVQVFEDGLGGVGGFSIPGVFSLLENKAKVLAGKLQRTPFLWKTCPRVTSRVVVGPENTGIRFLHNPHDRNSKVVKLNELLSYYKRIERDCSSSLTNRAEWKRVRNEFRRLSEKLNENPRSSHKLGKFSIRKRLPSGDQLREYFATDEAPCIVDVHLKEYPFEPLASSNEVEKSLRRTTRSLQVLRNLRHPYVRCVIGHFRTSCSLVQVSDWFEGEPLENRWDDLARLHLGEKVGLMLQVAEALAFCHSKGVFHRNLEASCILTNREFSEIRVSGFEFAKDLGIKETVSIRKMLERESRLLPPEDLLGLRRGDMNYRHYDIYQAGILFYRICENGAWPFEDALEYSSYPLVLRPLSVHDSELGFKRIMDVILAMIAVKPESRPDPMLRVKALLDDVLREIQ